MEKLRSSLSSAEGWSHRLKMMSPSLGSGTMARLGYPCPVGQPPRAKVLLLAQQDPLEWCRSYGSHMWPNQHNSFSSTSPPPHLAGFLLPAQKGDQWGWERQERTGRAPHPQSLSPGQPWPCQQLKWEKLGVGQKNREQFVCTGLEKASTDETKVMSFLASSDAWSNPEHFSG